MTFNKNNKTFLETNTRGGGTRPPCRNGDLRRKLMVQRQERINYLKHFTSDMLNCRGKMSRGTASPGVNFPQSQPSYAEVAATELRRTTNATMNDIPRNHRHWGADALNEYSRLPQVNPDNNPIYTEGDDKPRLIRGKHVINEEANEPYSYKDFMNESRTFGRPRQRTTKEKLGNKKECPIMVWTAGVAAVSISVAKIGSSATRSRRRRNPHCPIVSERYKVRLRAKGARGVATLEDVLYDTGAETSILKDSDAETLAKAGVRTTVINKSNFALRTASGSPMRISRILRVPVMVGSTEIEVPMAVSPDCEDSIIGVNAIRHYSLQTANGELVAGLNTIHEKRTNSAPILTAKPLESVHLKGRQGRTALMQLYTRDDCRVAGKFTGILDNGVTAKLISTDGKGQFWGTIDNFDSEPVTMSPYDEVGILTPVDKFSYFKGTVKERGVRGSVCEVKASDLERELEQVRIPDPKTVHSDNANDKLRRHTPAENEEVRRMLRSNVTSNTPPEYRDEILEVLLKNPEAFSVNKQDIGRCDILEHEIDVSTKEPLFTPQFRLANSHFEEIRDQIAAWTRAGLIRKERSAYNNPIFCVEKPHGRGLRVVSDFRTLNLHSKVDKYCIPSVDEVLARIGKAGAKVLTSLDLSSGFWHIPLKKEHQKYTAFTLAGVGQHVWTRAAMGLSGSPSTFSRVLDLLLEDLDRVASYVDDIMLYDLDVRSQARQLDVVLKRLTKAGLKVNPEKSAFAQHEIDYLGASVSEHGVRPTLDKVEALAAIRTPTTRKELSSVLGLFNYLSNYVYNFAVKATPLYAMQRKGSKWKGGPLPPEAAAAFRQLKYEVMQRPRVAFVTGDEQLHLYVDYALGSSRDTGSGMGAVLMQERRSGVREPVAFISRQLTPSEKNYPASLGEFKAAAWAMEKLSHYLKHRRFDLWSDCKPLVEINQNLKSAHKRTLKHCAMIVEDFYPRWRHIAGSKNTIADFLSRHFGFSCHTKPQSNSRSRKLEQEANVAALTNRTGSPVIADRRPSRTRLLQEGDPECRRIVREISDEVEGSTMQVPIWATPSKPNYRFTIIKDYLLVKPPTKSGYAVPQRLPSHHKPWEADGLRLFAPLSMRTELATQAHEEGHFGRDKSVARIIDFWWPGMDKEVEKVVTSCDTCLRATARGTNPPAPMIPIKTPHQVNELWHVDLFGPCQEGGNDGLYVMCVMDGLSNYAELRLLEGKSAAEVARHLYELVCHRGTPRTITSDRGLEFNNDLQERLWRHLRVERRWTAPYHPQVNGRAEVFNKVMAESIRKHRIIWGSSKTDFVQHLPRVQQEYNTSVNMSTKMSPHDVLFGYDARVPLNDEFEAIFDEVTGEFTTQDYLAFHLERQRSRRKAAFQNMQEAKNRMKKFQDAKRRGSRWPMFRPREAVLIRAHRKVRPNHKFDERWVPGYIIKRTRLKTFVVHQVGLKRNKGTVVCTADHIKPDPNRPELDFDEWVRRGGRLEDEQSDGEADEVTRTTDRDGNDDESQIEGDDVETQLVHDQVPEDTIEQEETRDDEVDLADGIPLPRGSDSDDESDDERRRRPVRSRESRSKSPAPRTRLRKYDNGGRSRSRSPRERGPSRTQSGNHDEGTEEQPTLQVVDNAADTAVLNDGDDEGMPELDDEAGEVLDPANEEIVAPPIPQPPARRRRRSQVERLEDSQRVFEQSDERMRKSKKRRRHGSDSDSTDEEESARSRRARKRRNPVTATAVRAVWIAHVRNEVDNAAKEMKRRIREATRLIQTGGAMEICEYLADGRLSLESVGAAPPPSGAGTEPAGRATSTDHVRRIDDMDNHDKVDDRVENVPTGHDTPPESQTLSNDTEGLDFGVQLTEDDDRKSMTGRLNDRTKRKRRISETEGTRQGRARNLTRGKAAPATDRQTRVIRKGNRLRGGAAYRHSEYTYHASTDRANTEARKPGYQESGEMPGGHGEHEPGPQSRNISRIKEATRNLLLSRLGRHGSAAKTQHSGAKLHQPRKNAPHLDEGRKGGGRQKWRFLSKRAPPPAGK